MTPFRPHLIVGVVCFFSSPFSCVLQSRDCGVVVSWEDEEFVTQTRKERKHPFQKLTMVTAYFDIGTFGKLIPSNTRSNMTYFQWFQKFGHVNNPLVVYTDSDAFVQHVLRVRFHLLACTRVVKVPRDLIWPFRARSKVAEVYAHPGYPKHFPNTVNPDYTCAIHAKFAVMRNAILNGYFPNEYYVWVDASGFRDLDIAADESFSLNTPSDLDPTRVMFSQVTYPDFRTTPTNIFHDSIVWVAGDAFVGKRDVVLQFSEQYRQATEIFLDRNLSNSDQQVIFAMYTNEGRLLVKPTVELQTITGDWFGVGYHCIRGGRS